MTVEAVHALLPAIAEAANDGRFAWREGETAVVHAPTWLPAGSDLEGAFGGDRTAAAAEPGFTLKSALVPA